MSEVVVLGGAGLQGAAAAKMLAQHHSIGRVVVADRAADAAEHVAAGIGAKATFDRVDARDTADVLRLLNQWRPRVVLNCVGPFRSLGAATLKAAIEAGVDYVDLLDDADVVKSYFALDDAARAAGVTAVFGVGFTPGLTNIIGHHLGNGLESIDEMHWTYLVNTTESVAPHLMTHRVQMFGRAAVVVRDGELVTVPGGSEPITIHWPGIGSFPATVCTHPEPYCAWRFYEGVQRATIRASYTSPEFLNLLSSLGNAGWDATASFHSDGDELRSDVVIGDFLSSDIFKDSVVWRRVLEAEQRYGAVDGVRVAVAGRRDGATVRRVAHQISRKRWFTTHGTAAVGAAVIASGGLTAPGVHSADIFDPAVMLPALEAAGIAIDEVDADGAPEFSTQ